MRAPNLNVSCEEYVSPQMARKQKEAQILQEFLKLQEKRSVAYNTLERCMKEVRETKQLCQFTDTMREITETFQTVSKAILKIVRALKDNDSYTTARRIDKLQDLEQLKLKLTANSHIKQQAIKNYHKEEDEQELRDIREEQANNIGKINEILEELRYIAYPEEQAA